MFDNYVKCGYRKAWVMFDLDNGHDGKYPKGYCWVFKTKREAIEHRRKQHNKEFGARLSVPILVKLS